MAVNSLQTIEALFSNLKNLTSDDNYKSVASIFDEIPRLQSEVETKTKEVGELKAEVARLESKHTTRHEETLELYCAQRDKRESEKGELLNRISNLTEKLKKRDIAKSELERARVDVQGQLDAAKRSLNDERKRLKSTISDITKLQQILKVKDAEADKLSEILHNEKIQGSKFQDKLDDIEKKNISLEEELRSNKVDLEELRGFATKLHEQDEQVLVNRLESVWKSARQVVESHFKDDIPETNLEDPDAWKALQESRLLNFPIPLPRSNTPAAKQMRIAAILAIISRCIDRHIFQPTFILDEDDVIRRLLRRLAEKNSKMESFCRALLLSTFPDDQARNSNKAVKKAVSEIESHAEELLSGAQYESFRTSVDQVVQMACDAWYDIQRAKQKFEPSFNLSHFEGFTWEKLTFHEEQDLTRGSDGDEELLVIFPRIYIIEDAEAEPITDGMVLMKSQIAAAVEEMDRTGLSNPRAGKVAPRSRLNRTRKSISMNGGDNFLP